MTLYNTSFGVETLLNEVENRISTTRNKRWVQHPVTNNNNWIQLQMQEKIMKHLKIEDCSDKKNLIEMKVQLENCKLKPKSSVEKSFHRNFHNLNSETTRHDRNTYHHSKHHATQISDSSSIEKQYHFHPTQFHDTKYYTTSSSSYETPIHTSHLHPSQSHGTLNHHSTYHRPKNYDSSSSESHFNPPKIQHPYHHHHHHHDHHGKNKQCSKNHDSTTSETSIETSKGSDKKNSCKEITDKLIANFKIKIHSYENIINIYKTKYGEIFKAYSDLNLHHKTGELQNNKYKEDCKNLTTALLSCTTENDSCIKKKAELHTAVDDLKNVVSAWNSRILKYKSIFQNLIKLFSKYKIKIKIRDESLKSCNNNENDLHTKVKELTAKLIGLNEEKSNFLKLLLECHKNGSDCQKNADKLSDDLKNCKEIAAANLASTTDLESLNLDQLVQEFEFEFTVNTSSSLNGFNSHGGINLLNNIGSPVVANPCLPISICRREGFNIFEYCTSKTNGVTLQNILHGSSKSIYYISPENSKSSFVDAKRICFSYNMYPLCIDDNEEYLALQQKLQELGESDESEFWLGHYYLESPKSYLCDADTIIPVHSLVPQNNNNNLCVSFKYHQLFSTQQTQDCKAMKRFICELRESCATVL